MKNQLVARILYEIADLLDLDGVAFKPRAYRRAAQVIESLSTPIEGLVDEGTHADLPGVGDAIAKKVVEIAEITARPVGTVTKQLSRAHERLRTRLKDRKPWTPLKDGKP